MRQASLEMVSLAVYGLAVTARACQLFASRPVPTAMFVGWASIPLPVGVLGQLDEEATAFLMHAAQLHAMHVSQH